VKHIPLLAAKVLVITLMSGLTAWAFNYFRPSPLGWSWLPPPPSAPLTDDFEALKVALQRPETVLVDARPGLFYKMGHLPGAVSLPVDETDEAALSAWRAGQNPKSVIIVYCTDDLCHMADQLSKRLTALGLFPTIFSPGFAGWEEAGLPIESDLEPQP
jgi:rhodanese-related sulfurtransferase